MIESKKQKMIKKKIVVVHFGDVIKYPPVLNLVECLLNNGYRVSLISENISSLPPVITKDALFTAWDIKINGEKGMLPSISRRLKRNKLYKAAVSESMEGNSILWTTNDLAVRTLNKSLLPYISQKRYIMQLMELIDWCPLFTKDRFFKFRIDNYARLAWKTVVPERNRAYIQKAQWNLKRTPYILPNKTYYSHEIRHPDEMKDVLLELQNEKRKIIIYLGMIGKDRNIEGFMKAVETKKEEYCLYIIGGVSDKVKTVFQESLKKYSSSKYLGYYKAPTHLCFLEYAYAALLPYKPLYDQKGGISVLNALYCAPNKIFEYSEYGVPMIGTDVLGLREPFERYNIGVCCNEDSVESIISAIEHISEHREEMSINCRQFYESIDFDEIVDRIINEP